MSKIKQAQFIIEEMRDRSRPFNNDMISLNIKASTQAAQGSQASSTHQLIWSYKDKSGKEVKKISSRALYRHLNKDVIRDLIHLVKNEEEVDEDTRRNILAVAHLLLEEPQKAEQILEND